MSVEVLMREIAELDPAGRRRLMAYMVSLQSDADETHRVEMARRIDDRDPASWATLEDLDRRLGTAQP